MFDLPDSIQDLFDRIGYGVTWCGAPSIVRFETDRPAAILAVSCDIAMAIPVIAFIAITIIGFAFYGILAKPLLNSVSFFVVDLEYQGITKPPRESIRDADDVPWRLDSADFTRAERRPPDDEQAWSSTWRE